MMRAATFASAALLCSLGAAPSSALAQGSTVVNPAESVTLNPQPLPPKVLRRDPSTGKAIIIVSGRDRKKMWRTRWRKRGGAVMLNPQPLPPKAVRAR